MGRWLSALAFGILGLTLVLALAWVGCDSPPPDGEPVAFIIPSGASFGSVVDTLQTRGLVGQRFFFSRYARFKGADTQIRSGAYSLVPGTSWSKILTVLTEGRVQTEQMTIPEGFRLAQMAPRMADITNMAPDSVLAFLTADSLDAYWEVPGPGLEGYLFPDSYYLARGVPITVVTRAMVDRYHAFWTPERIARRDSLGMTEREVVTLASIVQAEARVVEELPRISSVYHNRLERGQLLQADPTVLFALGGYRARLLFAAMDSVADHPYNTYTHPGLPPGPIGAPGELALDAALNPEESDFLYFMARTDGTHIFSRTLAEHNRAVASMRPEWERYRQEQGEGRR
jgi:UPF0755 protein